MEIATVNIPASEKLVILGISIMISHWKKSVTTFPMVLYIICFEWSIPKPQSIRFFNEETSLTTILLQIRLRFCNPYP